MSYTEEIISEIYPENYSFPMGGSFFLITFLTLVIFEREKLWKYICYSPGYGKVEGSRNRKTKKYELFVDSDIGKIKIPTFHSPIAPEIDIYLYTNPEINHKTGILSQQEFSKFPKIDYQEIKKEGNFFILPIIHTSENKKNKVSGWIRCLTSFHVYVFTVEDGFIDYKKLVLDYLEELENENLSLLEENPSSSNGVSFNEVSFTLGDDEDEDDGT